MWLAFTLCQRQTPPISVTRGAASTREMRCGTRVSVSRRIWRNQRIPGGTALFARVVCTADLRGTGNPQTRSRSCRAAQGVWPRMTAIAVCLVPIYSKVTTLPLASSARAHPRRRHTCRVLSWGPNPTRREQQPASALSSALYRLLSTLCLLSFAKRYPPSSWINFRAAAASSKLGSSCKARLRALDASTLRPCLCATRPR
jgi:hypothetical protein